MLYLVRDCQNPDSFSVLPSLRSSSFIMSGFFCTCSQRNVGYLAYGTLEIAFQSRTERQSTISLDEKIEIWSGI